MVCRRMILAVFVGVAPPVLAHGQLPPRLADRSGTTRFQDRKADNPGSSFTGRFADFRLVNCAFSEADVRELAKGEHPRRGKESKPSPDDPKPQAETKEGGAKVTAIPEAVVKRFRLDTSFYKKHVDYKGFSILGSSRVSDAALLEAHYLIDKLLGEREDILKAMIKSGCRFMVMAPTEMTTDVPEQRHMDKAYWDRRARGLGGKLSSCGAENLLNLKGDRYRQENILIHEFSHAIHRYGLGAIDRTFDARLRAAYRKAMGKGLWKGTYVATNHGEYWAEGVQAYFDCMRPQFGANTRAKLRTFDPDLFALVDEVYKHSKFRYVRYDRRRAGAKKVKPIPKQASLFRNLEIAKGQPRVIRGATSSLGQAALNMAVSAGVKVIAPTRTRRRDPSSFIRRLVVSTERKVAVITGASQGIGAGPVRGFLDRGYWVVANSRSIRPDPSADLPAVQGDITDPAVGDPMIAPAERFGREDTLVNDAGAGVRRSPHPSGEPPNRSQTGA